MNREHSPQPSPAAAAFLLYEWAGVPAIEVLLLAGVVGAFLLAARA
jgi:hypothetical protein